MATEVRILAGYDLHHLRVERARQDISQHLLALVTTLAELQPSPSEDEQLRAWIKAELERFGLL
jgi:hypothetical protein